MLRALRAASLPAVWLFSLLCSSPSFALSYVESSTGLATPALDGGRTEVEIGDVNADGNPDIVSIGDHGSPYINTQEHGVMVWFGNGAGAWSVFQYGDFGYGGVALGDANNDGRMDVGYAMHHNYSSTDLGNQLIEVALGDGTGQFWTPWDDGLATGGESYGMFGTDFADINNDGLLDIGSVSFGCCNGAHVYLNHGDGTWSQSWAQSGGNSTEEFVFGDVNNDGNMDFTAGKQSGTVYLGDGHGGFTLADGNLPAGGLSGRPGPDLGDVNGDGAKDISFITGSGGVEVWLWSPGGVWIAASNGLPASGSYESTQLADLDGDGRMDLAAFGHGLFTAWLGDGAGNWTQAASFTVGTPGYLAAFRAGPDADHNGFADFAVVDEEGSGLNTHNRLHFYRESTAPAAASARFTAPMGNERIVEGSVRFVDWVAAVPHGAPGRARLELSTSGAAGPWQTVADDLPDNGRYQWRVLASAASTDCRLRVRVTAGADTTWAVTPRSFTILFQAGTAVASGAANAPGGTAMLSLSPNPTSGGVWIRGNIARARVEVFDVRGRCVFAGSGAADGSLWWDGRDHDGRPAASGGYAVRVLGAPEAGAGSTRFLTVIR